MTDTPTVEAAALVTELRQMHDQLNSNVSLSQIVYGAISEIEALETFNDNEI